MGNKDERTEFVNNVFKQLVKDVVAKATSADPILKLRHAHCGEEARLVHRISRR